MSDRQSGQIKWSIHLTGWFELEIGYSLECFPLDYHDLRICLRSRTLDKHKLQLIPWPGTHAVEALNGHSPSSEWLVVGHRFDQLETDAAASHDGLTFSELHVVIMVQRRYKWYLINVFLFLFGIVGISGSVYAMPFESEDAVAGRTLMSVELIFAVIALKFVVAEHIPRMHYQTILDNYVWTCFSFIVISGIQSLFMYWASPVLDDAGNVVRASIISTTHSTNVYINSAFAGAVGLAFVLYHVALFRRKMKHHAMKRRWKELSIDDPLLEHTIKRQENGRISHLTKTKKGE